MPTLYEKVSVLGHRLISLTKRVVSLEELPARVTALEGLTVPSMIAVTLIAAKTQVDATDDQDGTIIPFLTGKTLVTSTPLFAVIRYSTGTFDACIISLATSTTPIAANTSLVGLDSSHNYVTVFLQGLIADTISDAISVNVNTPNGGASTFDILIYGIDKP